MDKQFRDIPLIDNHTQPCGWHVVGFIISTKGKSLACR